MIKSRDSKTLALVVLTILAMSTLKVHGQRRVARPSHDQIVQALDVLAQQKQVYWRVWCTACYEGDLERYQAVATRGGDLNIYAEDGATPYWQVYGDFKTADDAAYALLQKLRNAPNAQPQHRDKRAENCAAPLTGGPNKRNHAQQPSPYLIPVDVKALTKPRNRAHSQQSAQQPTSVPVQVALDVRTEQLAQSKMQLEFAEIQRQIDASPLGKRMKELQSQYAESAKKITEITKSICGEAWTLDLDSMKCVAPKPQEAKVQATPKP